MPESPRRVPSTDADIDPDRAELQMTTSQPVQFRLVTRYASSSTEAADENQRRIEGVFAELADNAPDNVSYIVLRLQDDSFLHLSFHAHGHDDPNPIASLPAFQHFQDGHATRRDGGVDQQQAILVGAYAAAVG
jgi:hypothetical protein